MQNYGATYTIKDDQLVITNVFPVAADWDGYRLPGYCRPTIEEIRAAGFARGYKPTKEDLKGLCNHRFETAGGLVLDCYLSYDAEERETQDEPGCAAAIELVWALVEGVDISEVLGDLAETIEEEALSDLADQIDDDASDWGEA